MKKFQLIYNSTYWTLTITKLLSFYTIVQRISKKLQNDAELLTFQQKIHCCLQQHLTLSKLFTKQPATLFSLNFALRLCKFLHKFYRFRRTSESHGMPNATASLYLFLATIWGEFQKDVCSLASCLFWK